MNQKNYIILFLLVLYIEKVNLILVLPFQVSELKEDDAKNNYTTKDFFFDFYQPDFYSSINISQKNTKILTRISLDNYTFFLSEDECKRQSIENAQNYLIITRNGYYLDQSSSYKNISTFNNNLTNYKNGGIITETFSFYNSTKLSCQYLSYDDKNDKDIDSNINLQEIKIIIEEYSQNKKCAVIGLGKPRININDGINFINELKRNKIINDYSFTYKFITTSNGQLIIGGLPHDYYNNSVFYKKYQFMKINTNSPNDYNLPWSISFNKIFIEKENNEKVNVQNNAKSYIVPNFGFIIGTNQYKKIIMENYFSSLIDEGICTLDRIDNTFNIFDLKNKNFEIFSCDIYQIKVEHKSSFPKIKFQQNNYDFIFFMYFYYLFMEFKERYYFLIIFPEDKYSNNNWYLGLPFIKRYQFIFNYDLKTIGFYNENIKEKNNTKGETGKSNKNKNVRLIIEIFVGILLIGLIVVAFIIGKRINNRRKNRANELNDDNYEYFSQENNNNPGNSLNS